MSAKKNKKISWAQIVASIALFAIFIGIIGTGITFLIALISPANQESQTISAEELSDQLWVQLETVETTTDVETPTEPSEEIPEETPTPEQEEGQ